MNRSFISALHGLTIFSSLALSVLALYQVSAMRTQLSALNSPDNDFVDLKKSIVALENRLTKADRTLRSTKSQNSETKSPSEEDAHIPLRNRVDENIKRLGMMDPAVLDSLDKKYQDEAKARQHQGTLIERKLARQKADVDKHGRAILDLARKAIGSGPEGDTAYNKLLSDYADTSVAGSAIAERALTAAIDLNTEDVEKYYNQLVSNTNYKDSVTEQGIEATPALQGYLARQYISTGRFEEANSLIESLSSEYGSQYVPEKGEGSRPEWHTGNDIATQLRQELQNATSGISAEQ
jgi:hypothetical protein